jgi:hypothetical protein
MGSAVRKWNQVVPLLASSIYVAKKPLTELAARPWTVGLRILGTGTALGLYTAFLNQFDEYRNADRKLKSTHLFIPGINAWVPIGAHGTAGTMVMAIPNAVNSMFEGDTKQLSTFASHQVGHAFSVPYAPSPFSLAQGLLTNRDYYGEIEPSKYGPGGREPREKADRFDARFTGPTAQWLGKQGWLPGSPAQWQFALKEATGGLYTRPEATIQRAMQGRLSAQDLPVIGRVFRDHPSTQSVRDFFDSPEKLTEQLGSLSARGQTPPDELRTQKRRYDEIATVIGKLEKLGEEGAKLTVGPKGQTKAVQTVAPLERTATRDREWFDRMGKYAEGLARFATGQKELPSFPNPLTAKDLPPEVAAIRNDFLSQVQTRATQPPPAFQGGDFTAYQKRFTDWRERAADARDLLKGLQLPALPAGTVRRRTSWGVPVAAGQ